MKIKFLVKKILARIGFIHPSMGMKITPEEKAKKLLESKIDNVNVFVETGTHEGWMINRIGNVFEQVYSVELNHNLFQAAEKRFKDKNNIKLFHGDSAILIKGIVRDLNSRALFWLDAHDSGEITSNNAPIIKELEAIFDQNTKKHIILIDDARHFNRGTIRQIKKITRLNKYSFSIQDGIFKLLPKS